MQAEDRVRLLHMVDACQSVQAFVSGCDRSALDSDQMRLFALVRAIEIIGGAASKVTAETRDACRSIPWVALTGMRNRLIHAYFDVDKDILWIAATVEVPALLTRLRAIIAGDD